jgi:hypothetical protein
VAYWTSGHDLDCPGRHRWCASNLADFVKPNLVWKRPKSTKSCVFLTLDPYGSDKAKLGTTRCSTSSKFICEVLFANFLFRLSMNICVQVRPQARGKLAGVVEECSEIHELDKCI